MNKKRLLILLLLTLTGCQSGDSNLSEIKEDIFPDGIKEIEELPWYFEKEMTTEFKAENQLDLATNIDDFLNESNFNGVALIAKEDQIIMLNAYGVANVENEIPMSVNTQFQIGSVSKPFIAISILQLIERGDLALDQTIDEFFPELERGSEITIHQLLTHSSGLNSGDGLARYSSFTTPEELISYAFKNIRYHNEPGFVSYSNLGYDMLGVIVEKITGQSYETYLQENILDIAHMTNSGLNTEGIKLENLATAYAGHISQGDEAPVFHPSFGFSSGGMHATAMDLFRFSQSLYNDLLLTSESYNLMTTPYSQINGSDYGFGWFINARNQEDVISHNGDLLGWHSILIRHQENDFTVILLTNQSGSARNVMMAHYIVEIVTNHN